MAEFSPVARLLATLLLLLLSLAAWKFVLQPSRAPETVPTQVSARSEAKRKPRKKPKKKSKPAEDTASVGAPAAAKEEEEDAQQSDSESDDDNRPASKQLATRRFKPAALGGAVKAAATPQGPRFELEQRVVARFQGGADWFPAVVTEVRRGNTYHLRYDDGEVEFHVPAELIRAEGQAAEPDSVLNEEESARASSGSESSSSEDEDDGWEVVGKAKAGKKQPVETESLVDGLTKRQRENRRKKERQREIKEMARRQAQEGEFDARARMKYVPPPTSQ